MRSIKFLAAMIMLAGSPITAKAQVAVTGIAPTEQAALLASRDPVLAANKRLVFDMWREFIEGGHMEVANKYFREDYIQHNPLVPTGRDAVVKAFSAFTKPQLVKPVISGKLVAIVAEGDLVTLAFVRDMVDPKNPGQPYTTTWFDMFRIQDGKIAEHWDTATKF